MGLPGVQGEYCTVVPFTSNLPELSPLTIQIHSESIQTPFTFSTFWYVSLILKCMNLNFFPLSIYTLQHNDKAKTDLAGPLKDIQRPKPLLCCLSCVLRVVLLEGEPLPQSEVLCVLEQVFIKDLFVLCSFHISLDPD